MTDHLFIAQLEKQYIPYLKNCIQGQPFTPVILRGGKNKPATTAELHQQIREFQAYEKSDVKKGWVIEWEEWSSKKLGNQKWPRTIQVTTEEDFLFLTKKEKEITAFKQQLQQLLQWNAGMASWLASKPMLVLELKSSWTGICSVVDYLLKTEVGDHYLRSIPVPVHTKFIEQHKKIIHSILHHLNNERFGSVDIDLEEALLLKKKPFLFPLRWLDQTLAQRFTAGMSIFAVPPDFLKQQTWVVQRVIVVENETNLYLFPTMPGTLVICSEGNALHLLKDIHFLQNVQLYYWSDLDEEGFGMLNDMRQYYGHVESLFMDERTVSFHHTGFEIKPGQYKKKVLPLLKPNEQSVYEYLLQHNCWLEQEKLEQAFLQDTLNKLFKS